MATFILYPQNADKVSTEEDTMEWDKYTQDKFRTMISKIPVFHRHITENAITIKAAENAKERNAAKVEEIDVISAFFSDVPTPFYSMMVRLLDQTGFDYKKYGFPKNGNHKT